MKKIAILGVTGSIGRQALDILQEHKDEFSLSYISAHSNFDGLLRVANQYKVPVVSYSGKGGDTNVFDYKCRYFEGEDALILGAENAEYDIFLNSVVGIAALRPTLIAMKKGARIALANKEMLVCAGEYVMAQAERSHAEIIPVDSEHSAIFQCLLSGKKSDVDSLIITSSGGAYRDIPIEKLDEIDPLRALEHPNWNMGKKITADCATMVNKAFEVIEAKHLFGFPLEKIETVIHRESIVHSMVRYKDGAVIAQLASPDMRLPIQYAFTYPERALSPISQLSSTFDLTFRAVDFARYPAFACGLNAAKKGGLYPCAYMSADDVIVSSYLAKIIKYSEISDIFEKVLNHFSLSGSYGLQDVLLINEDVKQYTHSIIGDV